MHLCIKAYYFIHTFSSSSFWRHCRGLVLLLILIPSSHSIFTLDLYFVFLFYLSLFISNFFFVFILL